MTEKLLLRQRLTHQQLSASSCKTTGEVVDWLGAVQAQDYAGALWSIGMRIGTPLHEAEIEKAIVNKSIVRTWPMRGTLHFVSPDHVRWMLHHLTPRVLQRSEVYFRKAGIDKKDRLKAKKVWEKALTREHLLTREEMYGHLERSGIVTSDMRGLFLTTIAAQEGLICFGPKKGKQQTFVLLDEWLPSKEKMLSRDEGMAALAKRYVQSHGPVQTDDFAWWAGITKTEATASFESIGKNLEKISLQDKVFWMMPSAQDSKPSRVKAYLLPTFDEYVVAYKDRSEITLAEEFKMMEGRFSSTVVIEGKVVATWRRDLKKDNVIIEIRPLIKLSTSQRKAIDMASNRLGKFLGKDPTCLFV